MTPPSLLASMLRAAVGLSLSGALALAPCVVVAAPSDDAVEGDAEAEDPEALSEEAIAAFGAKDYDTAVELFSRAHELDPQPNYLFNIGRVYEEKGDLAKAVEYYQRFVGESGVDLDARQAATERLRVLREALRQLEGDRAPEPTPNAAASEDPAPTPAAATDGSTDAPRDADTQRKLRIAGYSLLGVGGAALIVGGVVGGIALGTANDADDAQFVDETIDGRQRARTQANVADALFISGGVLAAVGLVLVLTTVGKRKGKRDAVARRTRFGPRMGPRIAGIGVTRRF